MHNNEFNHVLDELIECTYNIANDTTHLSYTEGFSVYGGYVRGDVIKELKENELKQDVLKKKLIQLYNNTLTV
jgi:hypothetical protein